MTSYPRLVSAVTSSFQPDESAQPPCTSTMVGLGPSDRLPDCSAAAVPTPWLSAEAEIAANASAAPAPRRTRLLRERLNMIAPCWWVVGPCCLPSGCGRACPRGLSNAAVAECGGDAG